MFILTDVRLVSLHTCMTVGEFELYDNLHTDSSLEDVLRL